MQNRIAGVLVVGALLSAGTALAQTTTTGYDVLGRVVSVTDPASETTSTVYDDPGRAVAVTGPDGKTWTSAYQVRRSEFDHLLLKNAAAKGAEVHEETRVTDIQFNHDGADVTVTTADGTDRHWRAAYVLDASGRDTLRKASAVSPAPLQPKGF